MIIQKEITLQTYKRGIHLITSEILNKLPDLPQTGIISFFVKHTSCSLTINENADPDVRTDLNQIMDSLIPENNKLYRHIEEGSDDMPAHAKTSLLGTSLTIPITNHRLNLGVWQGVYLCEFRNYGGPRKIVVTIIGE